MAFRAQGSLLKVGSYSGNGTSQSITGLGFSPEHAAVFSAAANNAVQRYAGASTSYQFDADTGNAQRITSLDANGFTVGNQNTVNTNTTTYHWIAFNDSAGIVDVNGYTGNNTDNRNITGVGFQPEYVVVRADDTGTARLGAHRPATLPGDSTLRHSAAANTTNAVQLLQSDGFQLGTDTSVNANTIAYRYLAVRDTADSTGGGCASSGSQLVAPAADSYVDQGSPTANNGTSADLFVQSKSGNANKRTLVRFNLPSIPAGCSLTGATLKLFSTAEITGRTIDVYRADAGLDRDRGDLEQRAGDGRHRDQPRLGRWATAGGTFSPRSRRCTPGPTTASSSATRPRARPPARSRSTRPARGPPTPRIRR